MPSSIENIGAAARRLAIIAMSLGIFLLSCLVMYLAWISLTNIEELARGVISLLLWIGTFAAASLGFWRAVERLSFGRIEVQAH